MALDRNCETHGGLAVAAALSGRPEVARERAARVELDPACPAHVQAPFLRIRDVEPSSAWLRGAGRARDLIRSPRV